MLSICGTHTQATGPVCDAKVIKSFSVLESSVCSRASHDVPCLWELSKYELQSLVRSQHSMILKLLSPHFCSITRQLALEMGKNTRAHGVFPIPTTEAFLPFKSQASHVGWRHPFKRALEAALVVLRMPGESFLGLRAWLPYPREEKKSSMGVLQISSAFLGEVHLSRLRDLINHNPL